MPFQKGNQILDNTSIGQGIPEIASQHLGEETQAINSSFQSSDMASVLTPCFQTSSLRNVKQCISTI